MVSDLRFTYLDMELDIKHSDCPFGWVLFL